MLGRKQQSQVARSFPNRYLFSYTNKVTSLFSISCILDIILANNEYQAVTRYKSRQLRNLICPIFSFISLTIQPIDIAIISWLLINCLSSNESKFWRSITFMANVQVL